MTTNHALRDHALKLTWNPAVVRPFLFCRSEQGVVASHFSSEDKVLTSFSVSNRAIDFHVHLLCGGVSHAVVCCVQ